VSTAKRSAAMPELGTIADDLPWLRDVGLDRVHGARGMPKRICERGSRRETRKILQDADIRSRFIALGLTPQATRRRNTRVPQAAERPVRVDREAGGPEAGLNASISKP